ncbi:MAG: EF-hand domain-containing protein [bacterium]
MVGNIGGIGDGGRLSVEKMVQKFFEKLDKDGDGLISKEEMSSDSEDFQSILRKKVENSSSNAAYGGNIDIYSMIDEIFLKADKDGDGKISKEELQAYLEEFDPAKRAGQAPPPMMPPGMDISSMIDDIFENADTDGDGKISKTELEQYFAAKQKEMDQKIAQNQGILVSSMNNVTTT